MRKVLITGASRGIGRAIADIFVLNGFKTVIPDRKDLDLSDPKSVENYVRMNRNECFDVIVNNAGSNDIHVIDEIEDVELDNMMNINLISPIRLLRGFVPKMKQMGYGRIVNIGSIWSVVSKPGRCAYSATKYGVHGVTNTLAIELAPYNILVNTICPGFTSTELTSKNNTETEINNILQDIPLGRMAQPKEIAEVVYFFCSDKNTYLTGQKITVDGGFTVK